MITAIELDDEPLELKVIENFANRIDYIRLEKTFTKTEEARKYLRKHPVDLIFLDIQMPKQDGMAFYASIEQDTMVVFTTAFSQYAVEGFNLSATDYLLKPFSFDRCKQATDRAKSAYDSKNQSSNNEQYLFIRADYSLNKIHIGDILYIEGLDDYLKIHIAGLKTIVARMTMKAILEKLPTGEFLRVHRSFIVPLSKIDRVRNKVIYIDNQEIPLSAGYEAAFMTAISSK